MGSATSRKITDAVKAEADVPPYIEFRESTGALIPHVASFYLYRHEGISIDGVERVDLGQMRFMLKGEGVVTFPDGHQEAMVPVMVNGPATAAMTYHVEGPFHCFGISLRGTGWKTLVGMRADDVVDTVIDFSNASWGDPLDALEQLRAVSTLEEMIAIIQPRLEAQLERAKPMPLTHLAFLQAVREWAAGGDPTLEQLYALVRVRSNIGERQVQRLCREYFAGTPAHLKRKFRAIGAAMRIYQGASISEVVGPFSDQPHMINEIRHFTGHTPTTLRAGIDPVLAVTLDNESFHFLPDVIPEEVDLKPR